MCRTGRRLFLVFLVGGMGGRVLPDQSMYPLMAVPVEDVPLMGDMAITVCLEKFAIEFLLGKKTPGVVECNLDRG